jgi:hypothetical protein
MMFPLLVLALAKVEQSAMPPAELRTAVATEHLVIATWGIAIVGALTLVAAIAAAIYAKQSADATAATYHLEAQPTVLLATRKATPGETIASLYCISFSLDNSSVVQFLRSRRNERTVWPLDLRHAAETALRGNILERPPEWVDYSSISNDPRAAFVRSVDLLFLQNVGRSSIVNLSLTFMAVFSANWIDKVQSMSGDSDEVTRSIPTGYISLRVTVIRPMDEIVISLINMTEEQIDLLLYSAQTSRRNFGTEREQRFDRLDYAGANLVYITPSLGPP